MSVGGWIGVEDSERRTDVRGRREGEWPRPLFFFKKDNIKSD